MINICVKFTFFVTVTVFICVEVLNAEYYGKLIGKLSELHHGVSGEVYAVDGRTLFIKDFTYDGQGPAAYFYASHLSTASTEGFPIKDENASSKVLKRYRKKGVTITLPEGKHLNNIKIFYVWCEEFQVNFGDVKIKSNLNYPRPQKIDPLKGEHAISSDNIVVVDAQTLLIPNLSYDGQAPDAKFWVGTGSRPTPQGIRVPDENGKELPLRRYDRKTVVLTLPGDLTIFDIDYFGIWCEAFTVDFGHIKIPPNLNVPPSLKMLGISPQSKLNCEVLYDDLAFEVRWAVAGDSIVLQLVSKLSKREYMSFGISGQSYKSVMVGGDVVVAWVDADTLKGYAEDYYLDGKSQCSGPTGSCPDSVLLSNNANNIRLLNAAMVNGYSIVTYQRPLKASDEFDKEIFTNRSQAIIWAVGPLNQRNEVSFHTYYTKGDQFINFGRTAQWNCPMPDSERNNSVERPPTVSSTTIASVTPSKVPQRRRGGGSSNNNSNRVEIDRSSPAPPSRSRVPSSTAIRNRFSTTTTATIPPPTTLAPVIRRRDVWEIPPIQCYEPEDGVFYAQMGPTGGRRGYQAITGHVGWGISWYINGLLIPEINVVRGKTYTFVVEGGFDPDVPAKYHPFYITDDPIGGYEYKTSDEKKRVRIFAGVEYFKDGNIKPIGTGRLCHWTQTGDLEADDFHSFGAYQRTLVLKCDQGEPGVIQWTPDANTPDTVYYQCFTHRYLGWKINVLDSCDVDSASSPSERHQISVPAPIAGDLIASGSQQIDSWVNALTQHIHVKNALNFDHNKPSVSALIPAPPPAPPLSLIVDPMGFYQRPPLSTPLLFAPPPPPPLLPPLFTTADAHNLVLFPPLNRSTTNTVDFTKITTTTTTTTTPTPSTTTVNTLMHHQPPPFGPSLVPLLVKVHHQPPVLVKKVRLPLGVRTKYYAPTFPYKFDKATTIYLPSSLKPNIVLFKPVHQNVANNFKLATTLVPSFSVATASSTSPTSSTKSSALLTSKLLQQQQHQEKLSPARNTGFRPESIVIEGGFVPILMTGDTISNRRSSATSISGDDMLMSSNNMQLVRRIPTNNSSDKKHIAALDNDKQHAFKQTTIPNR